MPESKRDVVIIGGGHNGLVTAFYLAKAGFKPLVIERRPQPGGAAITEEFHPGFRCSILAHAAGPLRRLVLEGRGELALEHRADDGANEGTGGVLHLHRHRSHGQRQRGARGDGQLG